MLNSCSIAYAKEINKVGVDNVVEQLQPYIQENGLVEEDVKQELKTFYKEYSTHQELDCNEGIRNLFMSEDGLDLMLLKQVKHNIRHRILKQIFGPNPVITETQLNDVILEMIYDSEDEIFNFPGLDYDILVSKNISAYAQNSELIASYLIGKHFPLLAKTWLSDFITENENGKYEFHIKTHVRQDYNTDSFEDKPAEMPNLIEILLTNTPIYDFYNFTVPTKQGYREVLKTKTTNTLNRNAFFYAVREIVSKLEGEDYEKFVKNPLYIFEYVLTEVPNVGFNINDLSKNIIASFATEWLYRTVVENDKVRFVPNEFYNQMQNSNVANSFNILHMLAATINKYTDNTFLDISLNEDSDFNIIQINRRTLLGQPFGALCTHINALKHEGRLRDILQTWDSSNYSKNLKIIRNIFDDYSIVLNEDDLKNLKDIFEKFLKSEESDFEEFVKKDKERKDTIEQKLLTINRTNVYLPKGSRKNIDGKQLPVYGINSAAADIKLEVVRTRNRQEENDALYLGKELAKIKRINSCQHSHLYKHWEKAPKTVYFSTIRNSKNGQTVVKEFAQLSVGEAFRLSFDAFMQEDGILRIQAITPSDKVRIPFHEFTKDFFKKPKDEKQVDLTLEEMLQEVELMYKQSILNSIIDVHVALHPEISWKESTDAHNWSYDELASKIVSLNAELESVNIDTLNKNLQDFNTKWGTNKSLSQVLDIDVDDDGNVQIAKANSLYLEEMSKSDYWQQMYLISLEDLKKAYPSFTLEDRTIDELIEDVKTNNNYTDTKLYEYFVKSIFAKENVLINTVGLPLAHKGKGGNWGSIDSGKHLTMTKRMVAMTSTSHYCIKGIGNGLPDKINTMTFDSGSLPMFVYSADTADGASSEQQHDTWDGLMLGTRIVDNMLKQSITDVRPKGNMLKVLLPAMSEEKAGAYLAKLAQFTIDNACLRNFANSDNELVGAVNPMVIMQLTLQNVQFLRTNVSTKGTLINRATNELLPRIRAYKKVGDSVWALKDYRINIDNNTIEATWTCYGKEDIIISDGCDLFSFWKTVLGGENSCSSQGVYGEQSQDMMTQLLINVRTADGKQYLKENICHYFPTSTVQKSTQAPIVKDLHEAQKDKSKIYTVKMDIERMGIQLDADHESEDAQIREVSQLMNNLAEGAYTPEKTKLIYDQLASLADSLQDYLDYSKLQGLKGEDVRKHLMGIFQPKIKRIFADPTLDIKGLANEIATAIKQYDAIYKSQTGESLLMPVSDRQVLSKYHTTVGSMLNKYIARKWTGRGDVLAPSVNLCMKYHWGGVDYFANDWAYDPDPSDPTNMDKWVKVPIKDFLHNKVWNEDGSFKSEFIDQYRVVSGSEIMPEDVLYRIDTQTGEVTVEVVNYYSKTSHYQYTESGKKIEGFDKMMAISAEIDQYSSTPDPKVIYCKAIDLPQNLRSKRIFVNVSWDTTQEFEDPDTGIVQQQVTSHQRKIGIYHFKSYKILQILGKLITKKDVSEEDLSILKEYVSNHSSDIIRSKANLFENPSTQEYYNLKKAVQYYFSRTLLPELNKSVVSEILANELNNSIPKDAVIPTRAGLSVEMYDDEKFTTNNYSHIYGKEMNLCEVLQQGPKWFKDKLYKRFAKTFISNAEFTLYSYGSTPVNITTDPSIIKNNKLHEIEVETDEDGYVINNGKRTFKLPKNVKLFSSSDRSDLVILTDPENLESVTKYLMSQKHFFAFRQQEGFNFDFINELVENRKIYRLFEDESMNEILFDNLASRQFSNFKETLRSLQARIPSQSMSFAMAMKTVGFLPWDTNITMVANSNVFIEGSDFDIDKVFSIMFHLNEHGLIDGVNDRNVVVVDNIANHPENGFSVEEAEVNSRIWELSNNTDITDFEFDLELDALAARVLELLSIRASTDTSVEYRIIGSDIRIDRANLYRLAEQTHITDWDNVDETEYTEYQEHCEEINYIITKIQERIADISKLDLIREGDMSPMQNNLLLQMISVFDDPRTLIATTTPTTMYPLKSTIERMPLKKERRNHHNFMTDFNVNKTAYTGKKDVGIAATGQKSIMGITQYYSVLYESGENMAHEFSFSIPSSWQNYTDSEGNTIDFGKIFSNFVLPGQKLNQATIDTLVRFGVLTVDRTGRYFYKNPKDKNRVYEIKVGDVLDITSVTDINSAFISAATDNAKEMLLDSLNASQEILPAFVFGVLKGVPIDLLTTMFTDELIPFILDKARGDLFEGIPAASSMASLLGSDKKINTIVEEYIQYQNSLGKTDINPEDVKSKLKVYQQFFEGASTMRGIGGILSINGGVDVHNGSSIEWMMGIQNTVNSIKPKFAPEFSIEEFLFADTEKRMEMCEIYRGDNAFTILDILTVVPQYASMCKVPYLYKICVESTSKDMEILHRFFKVQSGKNIFTRWKMEDLPNALRIINQVKIFEFLRELDFKYIPETIYSEAYDSNIEDGNIENVVSTSTPEGIFSLKKHIEDNIISVLKENHSDNAFVQNLSLDEIFLSLFGRSMRYYRSKINLSDKQYEDQFINIKLDYDKISQEIIAGHTVGEWMFLYDLLVNQHNIGGTSLTMCFGSDIDMGNPDNLIYKWIDFVGRWDSSSNTIQIGELYKSPDLDKKKDNKKSSEPEYDDPSNVIDMGDFMEYVPRSTFGWADPNVCPLFVKFSERFEGFSPIDSSLLLTAFVKGRIFITKC